jgi:hypothetical protein
MGKNKKKKEHEKTQNDNNQIKSMPTPVSLAMPAISFLLCFCASLLCSAFSPMHCKNLSPSSPLMCCYDPQGHDAF